MIKKDKYGAVSQIQPDGSMEGGDSAVWTGHYLYLTGRTTLGPGGSYVKFFEKEPGRFCRHPHPEMTNNGFGASIDVLSRDQFSGVLAGIINEKNYKAMGRVLLQHSKHLFLFSWNYIKNGVDPKTAKRKMPDITVFDVWAMEIRALGKFAWLLFPLLCILDIHMLFNTILVNTEDDYDQINYAMKLIISREHVPTPVSYLSLKLLNREHLIKNIKGYWNGWRHNPGMTPLYEKRIMELG